MSGEYFDFLPAFISFALYNRNRISLFDLDAHAAHLLHQLDPDELYDGVATPSQAFFTGIVDKSLVLLMLDSVCA
jgi:hypothetical protein